MATNLDFSALTAYTQENTDLLSDAILGTDTLKYIGTRVGVSVGTTTLNVFSADFADSARTCNWEASGEMTFDQIPVTVSDRQIKAEVCPTTLRDYWMSERMSPSGEGDLPFSEVISAYYLDGIKKNIEDFIGTELISASVNPLAPFNVQGGTPAALTVNNALEQLNDLYDALAPEVQDRDDLIMVMSPANYRIAVRAIVASGNGNGMYHYNVGDGTGDIYLPGTNAKLVKNSGFVNADTIVALPGAFAVFATGLMDDMDKFNIFYDQSMDIVKLTAYYRRGLGVYSPAKCATNGL